MPDGDSDNPVTLPSPPIEGRRFAEAQRFGRWDVYDWVEVECPACMGVGRILEKDSGEPERKCLDCRGTGIDHQEPDLVVAGVSEADARLLVFGGDLLAALEELLAVAPAFRLKPVGAAGSAARAQQDAHVAAEDRARAAVAKAKGPVTS